MVNSIVISSVGIDLSRVLAPNYSGQGVNLIDLKTQSLTKILRTGVPIIEGRIEPELLVTELTQLKDNLRSLEPILDLEKAYTDPTSPLKDINELSKIISANIQELTIFLKEISRSQQPALDSLMFKISLVEQLLQINQLASTANDIDTDLLSNLQQILEKKLVAFYLQVLQPNFPDSDNLLTVLQENADIISYAAEKLSQATLTPQIPVQENVLKIVGPVFKIKLLAEGLTSGVLPISHYWPRELREALKNSRQAVGNYLNLST